MFFYFFQNNGDCMLLTVIVNNFNKIQYDLN